METTTTAKPLPGTMFFATSAMRVHLNFGSGRDVWAIGDDDGTFAILPELPTGVSFIESTLSSSRRGAGTAIVVAYDPEKVRVHDFRR